MNALALALGLGIPWLLGMGIIAASWPRMSNDGPGAVSRFVGNGFFVGIIVLTLWMRGISALGWSLSWLSIGLPLGMLAAILLSVGLGSSVSKSIALRGGWTWLTGASLTRWQQIAWLSLLALLVSRFMLLGSEILWRPLYPWDAWTQWATKARVWYEFRHIVPFVQWPEWIATTGTFIDAAPHYPATMPLLQVWSCIAFGGWDDSAMNWPWLMILIALVCVIYGALRGAGVARVGALVGAYLVASLPLLDVHVALAGYADLAMGAFYTVAALAFYRWSMTRTSRDAVWALLLASSCALIKTPGIVWALTLVPGAIIVLLPRHGTKIVVALFAVAAVALVALAKFEVIALGYRLQLDFQPAWYSLFATYFLFGNWNLLWYMVIVLFALGWRSLRGPKLVPLTAVVAAAFGFLFLVFAFTNAAAWVADFTTVNRATLHFAPLLLTFCVLLWNEILHTPTRPAPIAAPVG